MLLIHRITLDLSLIMEPAIEPQHCCIHNFLSSTVSNMETVLKESLGKLRTTEVKLIDDGHHSTKAIVLAHAVSKGRFSDADYLTTTFPVMVECRFRPDTSAQPIIFCLADTLAEVKGACLHAFGADENSPVGVEVIWANNGPRVALGPPTLKMSERDVKATLRLLKARGGVDVLWVHSEA